MINREHKKGDVFSQAIYSPCERYRYSLSRTWQASEPKVNFIMLNPSTATETQNDPTVERCEQRARTMGFGGFCVTNIFAWRDKEPKRMRAAADPIGPENDAVILKGCALADHIIAAWGTHGAHLQRGPAVKTLLWTLKMPIYHLGLTKAGHPKHPLYLSYEKKPEIWSM